MPNWVLAVSICLAAILLETVCAGRDPAGALGRLRQPRWALSFPAWVVLGLAFYCVCFFALLRLLGLTEISKTCIALLVVLMAANSFWNYFFFRRRDFRISFWYQVPYVGVAFAFLWCVARSDSTVALAVGLYFLYLPYALAWTYRVWKLNEHSEIED